MIPVLHIEDYNYNLPDERIAKYPLERRDMSKLLVYKDGEIDSYVFSELPDMIPAESMMVFNDTKVVPARLFFVVKPVLISRFSASNRSLLQIM